MSPFHIFLGGNTADNGIVLASMFMYAVNDFQRKSHSVLQAAAIFIGPLIGAGRDKAIQQVSYSHGQLNGIKSRFSCPSPRFSIFVDKQMNLLQSKSLRGGTNHLIEHR